MRRFWVLKGLKMAALVAIAVSVFAYFVMSLWNFVLPAVAGVHSITFVQALALLALARILFGGFWRRRGGGWHWRERMRDRWERMTPEERERFRNACGAGRHCRTSDPSRRSSDVA
jgi:Ca2+/H+ antiporter, TMEM165/GDT1 family